MTAVAAAPSAGVERSVSWLAPALCSAAIVVCALFGGGVSTGVVVSLVAVVVGGLLVLHAYGTLRRPSALTWALLAFALWAIARSGGALGEGLTPLAVLLYAFVAWLAEQGESGSVLRALRISIAALALLAVIGYATGLGGTGEPGSHRAQWPVTYANGLAALLVLGVALWASTRSRLAPAATALCGVAAALTFSRAGLAALVAVATLAAARRLDRRGRIVAGIACALVLAAAAGPVWHRVAADAPDSRSASRVLTLSGHDRTRLWRAALDDARHAGPAGAGLGELTRRGPGNPHSLELQVAAELGWVGLALLLAVGVAAWRRSRTTAGALCALAWLVVASVDWIWLLPAATLPAVVAVAAHRPVTGLRSAR